MPKIQTVKKKKKSPEETPLMKQYYGIKSKYPDALLLFRVGDFYETFGQDAIRASEVLGIVLTKRANGAAASIELAGFPHHSLDTYLPKLVRSGQRVAVCDQLEDPKMTKTIVKRGVTELVTPGVSLNDQVLDHKKNNFLCALHMDKKSIGIAFLDVSTGEFMIAQGRSEYIDKLITGFHPSEVLIQRNHKPEFSKIVVGDYFVFEMDDWAFSNDFGLDLLQKHFGTTSLKGYGIQDLDNGIIAAGAVLQYLKDTRHEKTAHINSISRIEEDRYVWLDKFTLRNLEIFRGITEQSTTLLSVLDHCHTPMGGRLMHRWLALPLKEISQIKSRHIAVRHFIKDDDVSAELSKLLSQVGDIERLVSKISVGRISPREVKHLEKGLLITEPLISLCQKTKNESLLSIADQFNPCKVICDKIASGISEEPPALLNKGGVIRTGVNQELDELRSIAFSGKDFLVKLQQRESEKTGISSLKIGFNNVFGYYLEVTNAHKEKVPLEWIRKQTLVNAERYITDELKEYENKILSAESRILELETKLFNELVLELSQFISPIQTNAHLIAQLDCLRSFAYISKKSDYREPEMTESGVLDIRQGRHPVIEQQLPPGESYVANDVYLDKDKQQIIMITGPNMSGKSALLRQTALITLMAQAGCFVPANKAQISVVDKIFTRVGASDNISLGESTFMVEMNETASILNNLSDRSLILLDEIGRGTSTYDGISIAWAIAEYLHQHSSKAKTLFATHYHELNEMSASFPRIKNYNVAVRELDNKVVFLRKLIPGGSEHSFGIHVAQMAGMPQTLLKRARQILSELEQSHIKPATPKDKGIGTKKSNSEENVQLSFFQLDDPVLLQIRQEIKNLDINNLTPVEALLKLNEIKKITGLS